MKNLVIAIDGPAASGKSTTAKFVARKLGYLYIDSGAMYRAMTLKVLEKKINLTDENEISRLAEETKISLKSSDGSVRVLLDDRDVTREIRSREVTNAASAVSAVRRVRQAMVIEQQRIGREGGIVMDGRDIGTVVFPRADLKIFMVADIAERAKRRREDLKDEGIDVPLDRIVDEIIERDEKDAGRDISPLRKAADAVVVDTSRMTIDEQVKLIVDKARELIDS